MRANTRILRSTSNLSLMALVGILTLVQVFNAAADKHGNSRYKQTNLVSDQPGVAMLQDENLVNAWGISFGAPTPFWVSDNGTGLSTLYAVTNDSAGMVQVAKRPLEVTIPGEGNPTGQLFNSTGQFNGDLFIFASEDGTISGWRPALGSAAEVLANRPTAIYKGITLATSNGAPVLLVANFSEGTIDVYDGTMNLVGQFKDSDAPSDYAPFNVQSVGGMVFVMFAKQDAEKVDELAGPGTGLIDIFNPDTGAFQRFATGRDAGGKLKDINAPWGVALAPESFGEHGDELLVGNFGSGTIMAFDEHGKFKGLLKGEDNHPIAIDGLWALTFGNGTSAGTPDQLFFTAGPEEESHGLFGVLEPVTERRGHGNEDNQGRHH